MSDYIDTVNSCHFEVQNQSEFKQFARRHRIKGVTPVLQNNQSTNSFVIEGIFAESDEGTFGDLPPKSICRHLTTPLIISVVAATRGYPYAAWIGRYLPSGEVEIKYAEFWPRDSAPESLPAWEKVWATWTPSSARQTAA